MGKPKKKLTVYERRIAKALLKKRLTQVEITYMLSQLRCDPKMALASMRVSDVFSDDKIVPASDEELKEFKLKLDTLDIKTGLNAVDHFKLVKARESILSAVQIYNNPQINFKLEQCLLMLCTGWTYLIQAKMEKESLSISKKDQVQAKSLWEIAREAKDKEWINEAMHNNIKYVIEIRNKIIHSYDEILAEDEIHPKVHACCLNFDKKIKEWFGEKCSISSELKLSLLFAKLEQNDIATAQKYDIPETIKNIEAGISDKIKSNDEYQFRVYLTKHKGTKSNHHMVHNISNDSSEATTVVEKEVPVDSSDKTHPYPPTKVVNEVKKKLKDFSMHMHTKAWKKYQVRGKKGKTNTKKDYCIYHEPSKRYFYSQKWVDRLKSKLSKPQNMQALKDFKEK